MQYNIPDVHPATVINAFHQNVCNRKMREELAMNKVKDVAELYVLADRCARAEEGRKYPGEDACRCTKVGAHLCPPLLVHRQS